MPPPLKPIEHKSARWEPTADPKDIVVPGLDTIAPVNDQIDQIEQLITIKLQNIDANFSKMQQVLANRILPAVKRYSVGTEPVREAAKFWTTFYEQAAQIRVPTYEEDQVDPSEVESSYETSSVTAQSEANDTNSQHSFNPDNTASESSFMPGSGAVMSTPATIRHRSQYSHNSFASNGDQTPLWNASLESPLVRLDREIQSLAQDEDISAAPSTFLDNRSQYDESRDVTQRQVSLSSLPPQSDKSKGKAREAPEPLLRGVLKRNADPSTISPLKVKGRAPVLRKLNPYLPPDANPSDWTGVVDLSTPRRTVASSKPRGSKRSASRNTAVDDFDTDDDSFHQKLGMSPPITMAFATAPKTRTPKLAKTPRKDAAERIMQSLVDVEKQRGFSFTRPDGKYSAGTAASGETSLSNVPTPPSLSRYVRHPYPSSVEISNSIADASLESMMRRIGLGINEPGSQRGGSSARKADSTISSSTAPSAPPITSYGSTATSISALSSQKMEEAELESKYNLARVRDDDDFDMDAQADDFDDSLDYDDQPPLDYAPAPQQDDFDDDDSDDDFADNRSSDSFGDDASGMSNPFVEGGIQAGEVYEEDDDSLDDPEYQTGEEETLFGVPPAQRLAMEAALAQRRASQANFRMLGGQLLEDTIGIGAQMARAGRVEETPTPWPGAPGGAGR